MRVCGKFIILYHFIWKDASFPSIPPRRRHIHAGAEEYSLFRGRAGGPHRDTAGHFPHHPGQKAHRSHRAERRRQNDACQGDHGPCDADRRQHPLERRGCDRPFHHRARAPRHQLRLPAAAALQGHPREGSFDDRVGTEVPAAGRGLQVSHAGRPVRGRLS